MNNENRERCRALLTVLGLSISDAARVIRVSRPLLSRVLAGDVGIHAEPVFHKLEARMTDLVAMRKRPFFDLQGATMVTVTVVQRRDAA